MKPPKDSLKLEMSYEMLVALNQRSRLPCSSSRVSRCAALMTFCKALWYHVSGTTIVCFSPTVLFYCTYYHTVDLW